MATALDVGGGGYCEAGAEEWWCSWHTFPEGYDHSRAFNPDDMDQHFKSYDTRAKAVSAARMIIRHHKESMPWYLASVQAMRFEQDEHDPRYGSWEPMGEMEEVD